MIVLRRIGLDELAGEIGDEDRTLVDRAEERARPRDNGAPSVLDTIRAAELTGREAFYVIHIPEHNITIEGRIRRGTP